MRHVDLVIVGGGSAGMAAALAAREAGIDDILILEQAMELGGILNQCIHNGFGLHYFKEELAGCTYAKRFIDQIHENHIAYELNASVLSIHQDKQITYSSDKGYQNIQAKAVVLAMGCRERSRGNIATPGTRAMGVYTAGCAQYYLNIEGKMPGKKIVILGSGDIGLIMARRMTLEGAKVMAVCELQPYSAGLPRNIAQCLEDFEIPLYLSHTVIEVKGKKRVESVVIAQVDEKKQVIPNTSFEIPCDTLLLSVGLIPENSIVSTSGMLLDSKTKGAIVDEQFQTSIEGIFACGNVLHVHDIVDYVSNEGIKAGKAAASYIIKKQEHSRFINCIAKEGITYVLPQRIHLHHQKDITFMFRSNRKYNQCKIIMSSNGKILKEMNKPYLLPAEMQKVVLDGTLVNGLIDDVEIKVEVL